MNDDLPCPWLRCDGRGLILAVNARLCELVGAEAARLEQQSFESLLTPAGRVLCQSQLLPLLHRGQRVDEMALSLRIDPETVADVLAYAAWAATGGTPTIELVLAPIRTRRWIEDEALRIKSAADNAPGVTFQLLCRVDGSRQFAFVSEGVSRLYGVTPADAGASATSILDRIDRDDRAALEPTMQDAARRGTDWRGVYRVRSPGGDVRRHEAQATPRSLASGGTLWHGSVVDVTEQHAAHARDAESQADERARGVRSEFLGRFSHELRTPLNGILGFAQLLAADAAENLTVRQREQIAIVLSSGRHLLRLVDEVLETPRADDEKPQAIEPAPTPAAAAEVPTNVLYVEDNETNAALMGAIFAMRPRLVLQIAVDGAEALRAAAAQRFELLLLDMYLPDTDGVELLKALRRLPDLRDVPAILVSATAEAGEIARAASNGFSGCWPKPIDIPRALAELDTLLPPGV